MLGIKDIEIYIPEKREFNRDLIERFELEESFLIEKIGVLERSIKSDDQETSDMAFEVLERLIAKQSLARESIDALVVVTQNPDSNLPHVSALVHGKAKLSKDCAAFDLSLGCSGYVYGLSVLQSFLVLNDLSCGVLITCDPYSKVIDKNDKNTVLLFGDAATATLVGNNPNYVCESFVFGTQGDLNMALVCHNDVLHMNGREVFNFAAKTIPSSIDKLLKKANIKKMDVDAFIFHQGSRFIVETLAKRIDIDITKVRIDMEKIGNTVSSSIPILLKQEINSLISKTIVLCGFGVGLSWASCICKKIED